MKVFFLKIFSQAEAVPDRLPCKGADVPEGELGVENLQPLWSPVNSWKLISFLHYLVTLYFVVDVKCGIAGGAYRLHEVMIFFCDSKAPTLYFICHSGNT